MEERKVDPAILLKWFVITPIPTATTFGNATAVREASMDIGMLGYLLTTPYTQFIGESLFWGLCFSLVFISIFARQESVIVPTILGILVGGTMLAMLPPEFSAVANGVMIAAVAGLGYAVIMKKVR